MNALSLMGISGVSFAAGAAAAAFWYGRRARGVKAEMMTMAEEYFHQLAAFWLASRMNPANAPECFQGFTQGFTGSGESD
jgi:hypothetical protein